MANCAYLDVEEVFSKDGWTVIDRSSLTIELATKHLCADRHTEHIAGKFSMGVQVVDSGRSFEDLNGKDELMTEEKPQRSQSEHVKL